MLLDLAAAAAQSDPADPADPAAPDELILKRNGTLLALLSAGEDDAELSADRLRAACRCAWCTKARVEGTFPTAFSGLAITQIRPIGGYAVNLHFSDGHERGVFPWAYLRQIAAPGN